MSDDSALRSSPRVDDWAARLEAAADDCEAKQEAAHDAHVLRDELIVDACEAGHSQAQVARWARVSQSRVNGILAEH